MLRCKMLLPERQLHRKSSADSQAALYRNRAAMHIHKLLHESQAYAAALMAATARIFNAPEPLKQVMKLLFRDACSGVGDFEEGIRAVSRNGYSNFAFKRGLQGIREQIENNLFPHLPVNVDRLRQWWTVHGEPQAPLFRLPSETRWQAVL